MQQSDFMDLLILERKRYGKLNEIVDLTHQLAEAVNRQDQVSVRLLMAMRQEPILRLKEIHSCEEQGKPHFPVRVVELLCGEPAQDQEEKQLADQVAMNRRLSQKLLLLDEQVNRKMGGKKSYYSSNK